MKNNQKAFPIFRGRCPRCGKGTLYRGLLTVVDRCDACGLSFAGHEIGDGPAFFGILIIGGLTAILAAMVEIRYSPPFWLHAALWGPFIAVGSVMVLRWSKAAIITMQYRLRGEDFVER